ncbi:hypothetical protein MANES_17G055850v8 [Manihot esculenta]|uniref:Uncharacterized protein n=1 Tax=Manihot esculenta TaxID=3983 RepID=A0A2C9U759_MANES|nr:hypothetical protein MANES_17G055850v8 [Manihot esculenta]
MYYKSTKTYNIIDSKLTSALGNARSPKRALESWNSANHVGPIFLLMNCGCRKTKC